MADNFVGLDADGEFSYNGYQFDGAARIRVESEPIPDDANRTVVYIRLQITVEAVVAATTTDANLEEIRELLSQNGGVLIFRNKGFGNIVVNRGTLKDIKWGPKVEILNWEPLGGPNAAAIVWTVVTHIPACRYHDTLGLVALNYEMEFNYNERGETARTISGYLQIQSARVPRVTADLSRDNFQVKVPLGFKRTSRSWKTNADKTRADFRFVDVEISSLNPYPPAVINIDAKQRTEIKQLGEAFFTTTITASIELIRSNTPALAWLIFLTILRQRFQRASSLKTGKGAAILESVTITEDFFGYTHTFSARYTIMQTPKNVLFQTGHWTPLGTDWGKWRTSMNTTYRERGSAGLFVNGLDDSIIDICNQNNRISINQESTIPRVPFTKGPFGLVNEKPDQEFSFLKYDVQTQIKKDERTSQIKKTKKTKETQTNEVDTYDSYGLDTIGTSQGTHGEAATKLIYSVGDPDYSAIIAVDIVRAGYEIETPILKKVGVATATKLYDSFRTYHKTTSFGLPIYGLVGFAVYSLDKAPGKTKPPPNRMHDDPGGQSAGSPPSQF